MLQYCTRVIPAKDTQATITSDLVHRPASYEPSRQLLRLSLYINDMLAGLFFSSSYVPPLNARTTVEACPGNQLGPDRVIRVQQALFNLAMGMLNEENVCRCTYIVAIVSSII